MFNVSVFYIRFNILKAYQKLNLNRDFQKTWCIFYIQAVEFKLNKGIICYDLNLKQGSVVIVSLVIHTDMFRSHALKISCFSQSKSSSCFLCCYQLNVRGGKGNQRNRIHKINIIYGRKSYICTMIQFNIYYNLYLSMLRETYWKVISKKNIYHTTKYKSSLDTLMLFFIFLKIQLN